MNENKRRSHGNEGPESDRVHRHHGPYWKRAHHDWRFWAGLIFMLVAITIYVVSDDFLFLPGSQPRSASTSTSK